MRALAREVAFKKIYESLFVENEDIDVFFEIDNLNKADDKVFSTELVNLYNQNKNEINALIDSLLVDYSPSRVFKIDRAILALAITEMNYYKQTPISIVISEAVVLAKKFGTEKSHSFVNGVLKSVQGVK